MIALYWIRLDWYWTELRERSYSQPHNCTFKHDKHEQRKQAAVPVLVETPQRDTESLDSEEGRSGMFCR